MGRPLTLCCFVVLLATFALISTAFEEDPEILANIAEGEALLAELNDLLGDSGVSNEIKVNFFMSVFCLMSQQCSELANNKIIILDDYLSFQYHILIHQHFDIVITFSSSSSLSPLTGSL